MSALARPKAYSYIRLSTAIQLKGDGLRRQMEQAEAYAKAHDLDLVEEVRFEDKGVSAFRGDNVAEGELGKFLHAVEDGTIAQGSYLLVEAFDRLSRQTLLDSLQIFIHIINSGVVLVTLKDARVFTKQSLEEEGGFAQLVLSLAQMARAHDESKLKSFRVKGAWNKKRIETGSKVFTAMCPAWLRPSSDGRSYEVIEDRAQIVRRIFQDTVAGVGNYKITRTLNEQGTPTFERLRKDGLPFKRSHGWHNSYVAKILNNRAVIGEFQFHEREGKKKRIPVGAINKGHFPAILDEELFYRAQVARRQRRFKSDGGRRGQTITNLFSHLARCAYCGSPMRFENKGGKPKGGRYLLCEPAKRGKDCVRKRWRYSDFETSFLRFVEEIDLGKILSNEADAATRNAVDKKLESLNGQRTELEKRRDRAFDLYVTAGGEKAYVGERLREIEQKLAEITGGITEAERARDALESENKRMNEGKQQIVGLIRRLQSHENPNELFRLRSEVAYKLRSIISSLTVAVVGNVPLSNPGRLGENSTPSLKIDIMDPRSPARYFAVTFKSGDTRIVYPDDIDPLKYQQQIVRKGDNAPKLLVENDKGDPIAIEYEYDDKGLRRLKHVVAIGNPIEQSEEPHELEHLSALDKYSI